MVTPVPYTSTITLIPSEAAATAVQSGSTGPQKGNAAGSGGVGVGSGSAATTVQAGGGITGGTQAAGAGNGP